MPGFLDKLSKSVDSLASQVQQGLSQAGSSPTNTAGSPPATTPVAGGFTDDDWIDGTAPCTWLSTQTIGDLTGVPVDPPLSFSRDDAEVCRYSGADHRGQFTFDLGSMSEDAMVSYGSQGSLLDGIGSHYQEVDRVQDGTDGSIIGTSGPGHAVCVSVLADLVMQIDVYGPPGADLREIAHRLALAACKLS